MVWGMTAGVAAGLVPAPWLFVLHGPTRLLLWWIGGVAQRAAAAPLGRVGVAGVTAIAVGLALRAASLRLGARGRQDDAVMPRTWAAGVRRVGTGLVVAAVATAALGAHAPPGLRSTLAPGVVRWHGPATEVVALGGGGWRSSLDAETALGALRTAGVGAIDVLVVVDGEVPGSVVAAVRGRHPTGRLLVPPGAAPAERPIGAVALPRTGTALAVGGLDLLLTPVEDRIVVEAWPARR
jgi:hypothetical protein